MPSSLNKVSHLTIWTVAWIGIVGIFSIVELVLFSSVIPGSSKSFVATIAILTIAVIVITGFIMNKSKSSERQKRFRDKP
jgi:uncharacterized membrane protein